MSPDPASALCDEPTVHNAERSSGASGGVEWWGELTEAEALQRRRQGLDIVVRGDNEVITGRKAREIETALGEAIREAPHAGAGPRALPHYQQKTRSPSGHSFYETERRKAKRRKAGRRRS